MKKKSRHQQYIVQQLRNQQQKQIQQIQQSQGLNPPADRSATNSVMGHPVLQQQQQIQTPVVHPRQESQSAYPQNLHFEPPQHYQPPPPRRHIYVHEPCN